MASQRASRNYVNNPDFLAALIEHKRLCELARQTGTQAPMVSNYIGHCIQTIATRLASKHNFAGYPFKEDMIMDGVENCLLYIENFDPEKSSNPFAYFTQFIWYAFLRRIAKEKKYLYIKLKSSQMAVAFGNTHAGGEEVAMQLSADTDYIDSFVADFEDKLVRDREKTKKRGLVE
jgi:hypothetical protein